MKIDMSVEGVSFELIPENEEDKAFLKSWFANGRYGSIDIHYRFENTKTGSIGLRLYKQTAEMLKVQSSTGTTNLEESN